MTDIVTFVVSDIHGEYELVIRLLEAIHLKETDTLYVLGDILDRGPHLIQIVLKLMKIPNTIGARHNKLRLYLSMQNKAGGGNRCSS